MAVYRRSPFFMDKYVYICYDLSNIAKQMIGVRVNDILSVRMDRELKKAFTEVVESVGLDAPTAVRMFATQTVKSKTIPLSLSAKSLDDKDTLVFLDSIRADWGEW